MLISALKNGFFGTPRRRLASICTLATLVVLLVCVTAGMRRQIAVLAAMPTMFAVILFYRFCLGVRSARLQLMRQEMRMVRSWRAFAKPNPVVSALHYLAVSVMFFSIVVQLGGWAEARTAGLVVVTVVLAIAGLCETTVRTSRIVKSAWAPTIGKLLSVSVCVILAAISLAIAKQVTHSLVNIDPKYFIEFVSITTFLVLPLTYLTVAAGLLGVYAVFQFVTVLAIGVADMFLAPLQPVIGNGIRTKIGLYWYRILNGHKPLNNVIPKLGLFSPGKVALIASPMSKFAVVLLASGLVEMATEIFPNIRSTMTDVLISLEYRAHHRCVNIAQDSLVAYMEDGWVSVAIKSEDSYKFDIVRCSFVKE